MGSSDRSNCDDTSCPSCPRDDFDSSRAMKIHHKTDHGESLALKTTECTHCGQEFQYYPSEKPGKYCEECVNDEDVHWTEKPPENNQTDKAVEIVGTSPDVPAYRKGKAAEAIVLGKLAERGIPVSVPWGDIERYDFIVEHPSDGLLRVQCKTGRIVDGSFTIECCRSYTTAEGQKKIPYDGEFDYYIIYSYETEELYWVSESEADSSKFRLRMEPTTYDFPDTTWASDYTFDDNW